MKEVNLDFDGEVKVSLKLFEKNTYEKIFHVTKNGVDYTWPNVTEIVLQIKKEIKAIPTIELKLSSGDIVLTNGYMTLKMPALKTTVPPGDYKSVTLMIVFSDTKQRIWWHGGECNIKVRGI